jgi:pimeloyl-ACP methyl ester carboxylesterase
LGLRVIAADPSTIDPELVRLHVEMFQRHREDPDAAPAFLEAARSLMALGRRAETARWIVHAVRCPVLVIHGRRDRLVPLHYAERALEEHPTWEMRVLPKVGHVPQMEAGDRWLAAVESWLFRLPVAAPV